MPPHVNPSCSLWATALFQSFPIFSFFCCCCCCCCTSSSPFVRFNEAPFSLFNHGKFGLASAMLTSPMFSPLTSAIVFGDVWDPKQQQRKRVPDKQDNSMYIYICVLPHRLDLYFLLTAVQFYIPATPWQMAVSWENHASPFHHQWYKRHCVPLGHVEK